jgi:Fe-Mn family superoxide dismutase
MLTLPALPYAYDALEPIMSETTLRTHHDKHHAKYVEETNKIATDQGLDEATLEEIVALAEKNGWSKLYNNAAQAWNHGFFWNAMTPAAGQAPARFLSLRDEFIRKGAAHFGSGWVWVIAEDDKLSVVATHDAANFVGKPALPVLVCDLWEHAYYLDYKNDRQGFLAAWWDKLANWSFAEAQLAAAHDHRRGWRFDKAA